jgi:OOP family OmpA-OmpF porin
MMKKEKSLVVVLGFAVSMAFAIPAGAQDKLGGYVGGSIGQAKAKDACSGVGSPFSCDDTDMAFRILGGYQFNRNFAAEAGYHNFGKAKLSGLGITADVKSSAWELVGIGAYPISPEFSVYGKLGLYYGDTKFSSNCCGSASDTNTDMTFGFGVQYNVTPQLGVRGEYQSYSNVGSSNVGETDINVFSIGVIYRFQ